MILASGASPIFCATAGAALVAMAKAAQAMRHCATRCVMTPSRLNKRQRKQRPALPAPRCRDGLLHARGGASFTRQFQDMHAGIGAVDDVDVAAVIGFHIVALDRDLAAILAVDLDAALVGRLGDRRDEVADLLR